MKDYIWFGLTVLGFTIAAFLSMHFLNLGFEFFFGFFSGDVIVKWMMFTVLSYKDEQQD